MSTVLLALATFEPLVLIPDPIASKMLDLALPENWIWDQGEGVLIPDSLLGHGPFCFVAGPTLRTSSQEFFWVGPPGKLQAASWQACKLSSLTGPGIWDIMRFRK